MPCGSQHGVKLDENVVVIGVLVVTLETHGCGKSFRGFREVAAFPEGEIRPAFLEAGRVLDGYGEAGHLALKVPAFVDGNFLRGLVYHQQKRALLWKFPRGLVAVKRF